MELSQEPAYGLWSLVFLNSLIFIAFAFSFARPRSARDWRSFGAFSAFLVALFTEMYGFPLTIYLLSGWLGSRYPGIDFMTHDAGHLLETLFGWRANPHFGPFHLLSFAFIGGGFWLLAAAWKVLWRAQRSGSLATDRAYARMRHPQYVGFVLILFGFLLQWPTLLTLAMFPVLVFMYVRLALREEREAERQFGEAWLRYAARTPRFVPRWRAWSLPLLLLALWGLAPETLAQTAPATTQSSSERGVTIKVTPKPAAVDDAEWQFTVVLDTHSGQISDDLVQTAVLVIDGREIKPLQWSGAAPGGHHLEGVLAFAAPGQPVNAIELRIQRVGEAAPRVFRWDGAALR
jgi:protein-S-isoprenylcysteine O-methyltransferase Ste14